MKGLAGISVVLALLGSPVRASSQSQEPELALGIQQVREGDLEGAAATLKAVAARLESARGAEGERAQALIHLAWAQVGLDEVEGARASLAEAWRANRMLSLDPREIPLRIILMFQEVTAAESRRLKASSDFTRTLTLVTDALEAEDPRAREAAALRLVDVVEPALAVLTQALKDPRPATRASAVQVLALLMRTQSSPARKGQRAIDIEEKRVKPLPKDQERRVVEAIVALLKDEDDQVRARAQGALLSDLIEAEELLQTIQRAKHDRDPRMRQGALALEARLLAAGPPTVSHKPVGCLIAGAHATLEAKVEPLVAKSRLYFKSSLSPQFFYGEMVRSGERFVGWLPKPRLQASPITYLVEARAGGQSQRTAEFSVTVVKRPDECPSGQRVAPVSAPPVDLTFYSTEAGAPVAVPGGFVVGAGALLLGGGAAAIALIRAAGGALAAAAVAVGPAPTPTPASPPPAITDVFTGTISARRPFHRAHTFTQGAAGLVSATVEPSADVSFDLYLCAGTAESPDSCNVVQRTEGRSIQASLPAGTNALVLFLKPDFAVSYVARVTHP